VHVLVTIPCLILSDFTDKIFIQMYQYVLIARDTVVCINIKWRHDVQHSYFELSWYNICSTTQPMKNSVHVYVLPLGIGIDVIAISQFKLMDMFHKSSNMHGRVLYSNMLYSTYKKNLWGAMILLQLLCF
jgi:hypothetical protein